jgi:hypothetical protein
VRRTGRPPGSRRGGSLQITALGGVTVAGEPASDAWIFANAAEGDGGSILLEGPRVRLDGYATAHHGVHGGDEGSITLRTGPMIASYDANDVSPTPTIVTDLIR